MSIADAHRFIAATRADAALRTRIAAMGAGAEIEQLVALGAQVGFAFDAVHLRAAWRQDWTLRGLAATGGNG